jgi:hypothetical protein
MDHAIMMSLRAGKASFAVPTAAKTSEVLGVPWKATPGVQRASKQEGERKSKPTSKLQSTAQ